MKPNYPIYNIHDYKGESFSHKIHRLLVKPHILFHDWKLINWSEHTEEILTHYDPGIGYEWYYYRWETYVCRKCGKRKERKVYHDKNAIRNPNYIKWWGKKEYIVHEA